MNSLPSSSRPFPAQLGTTVLRVSHGTMWVAHARLKQAAGQGQAT